MWFDDECLVLPLSLQFSHVVGEAMVLARKHPSPGHKVILLFVELSQPEYQNGAIQIQTL